MTDKEALAQPEKEPVQQCKACFGMGFLDGKGDQCLTCNGTGEHPPQRPWVGLTDTQIEQVYFEVKQVHLGAPMPWGQVQFGKALLEKFKEVNT